MQESTRVLISLTRKITIWMKSEVLTVQVGKDYSKPSLIMDTVNVTCEHECKKYCENSWKYRDISIVNSFAISKLFQGKFVLSR